MPKYSKKDKCVQDIVKVFEYVLIQNGATEVHTALPRGACRDLLKTASGRYDTGLLDNALSNCTLLSQHIKRIVYDASTGERLKYRYYFDLSANGQEHNENVCQPKNSMEMMYQTMQKIHDASFDNFLRFIFRKIHQDTRHDITAHRLLFGDKNTDPWALKKSQVISVKTVKAEMETVFLMDSRQVELKFLNYPYEVHPLRLADVWQSDVCSKDARFACMMKLTSWFGETVYMYIDLSFPFSPSIGSYLVKTKDGVQYLLACI